MNKFLLIPILCFCLMACTTKKGTQGPVAATPGGGGKDKKELTADEKRQVKGVFMQAMKEKLTGNIDEAIELFEQVAAKDPDNDAAHYELSGLYSRQERFEMAIKSSREAVRIDANNEWYLVQLAYLYQENRYYKDALAAFEQLAKKFPDKPDYFFPLAQAHILNGSYAKAIDAYDKVEEKLGVTEEVTLQKFRLYEEMGESDKAMAEVQKLIGLDPTDIRPYGILAEMYEIKGQDDKAIEMYNKIIEIEPENGVVRLSLYEYYRDKGNKEKSLQNLRMAMKSPNVDIDDKMRIMLDYYSESESNKELLPEAYELCDLMLEGNPESAKGYAMKGDFLFREEKTEEARDMYRTAIEKDNSRYVIWSQLLLIESQLEDFDAMLKESAEAVELFPTQPGFYFFNGVANIQKKDWEEAAAILSAGKDMIVDNVPLSVQFYQNLGDVYNQLKQYEDSDDAFETALTYDPENLYVMNNYAYFLSLRGKKLDRAEELAKKCNELAPENASYQDTYAWVLFKSEKFEDAKRWMEKAIGNGAESGVILEHYGDVLFKTGETEKALEQWKKAKEKGNASELIDKKIEDGKYYE